MSIANLLTQSTDKEWANIHCKELDCKDINCVNLNAQNIIVPGNVDIDNLFVKDISVSLPDLEIKINSNVQLNAPFNVNNNVMSAVSQLNSDHGTAINYFPGGGGDDIINLNAPRLLMSGYIDMDGNDIINVNDCDIQGLLSYPNAILNNSATEILVKDGNDIKYRDDSTFGNMRFIDKVYLPVSNYTTGSGVFVAVGNDLSITDLEAGDYILQYSCTLRNTTAGSGTECEMLQDGITQLDIFGMEGFTTTSLLSSFSGTAHINIPVTATTSFRMGIRALANTAVLNKYSVTLMRLL